MGSEEVNPRVHVRAAFQHGLISFKQLLECGVPRATVSWRVRNNELKRVFPGVYVIAGTRLEWMQWLSAAVLWSGTGAAVAGRAAAELHRLDAVMRRRCTSCSGHA